jgi:hypothetical protein
LKIGNWGLGIGDWGLGIGEERGRQGDKEIFFSTPHN